MKFGLFILQTSNNGLWHWVSTHETQKAAHANAERAVAGGGYPNWSFIKIIQILEDGERPIPTLIRWSAAQ